LVQPRCNRNGSSRLDTRTGPRRSRSLTARSSP
jgi:hypothetical protein